MKITTTIMDIMQSELINIGLNEFSHKHQLTFYDRDITFIKKVIDYDEDVEKCFNEIIFNFVGLDNPTHDKLFKKTFINRFLNRQIGFQTIEGFSSQVIYTFLINKDFIETIYNKIDDFVDGKTNVTSESKGLNTSDNRYLSTSLPQSEVNLNVDNTTLAYGDTNSISRTKDDKNDNSKNESTSLNIDNLIKSKGLLESIFNDFDYKCFLQIW